jgi:hypothetical protein
MSADETVEEATGQTSMFGDELEFWHEHWQGMPEFDQRKLTSEKQLIVHFADLDALKAFAELVGQRITPLTQSIWFPEAEIGRFADKRYADAEPE